MARLAPPLPPLLVALDDDDRLRRAHARVWAWWVTLVTVVATAWCCTLGWLPAIIALLVAKHVLVALIVLGQDVNAAHPWHAGGPLDP